MDNKTNVGESLIDKYVIVRGDRSGVFAGTLKAMNGQQVMLTNCRKLWYWDGAAAVQQIAANGVTKPGNCKFTVTVREIVITDAIEIIEATDKAEESIKGVPEWRR